MVRPVAHTASLRSSGASAQVGVGARRASAARTRRKSRAAGHVVHAHDLRAAVGGSAHRGERAGIARGRRPLGERADEVLARDREQQRPAQLGELRQPAQHLDRLGGALGDVDARVEDDLLVPHARLARGGHALAQELAHVATTSS